MSIAILHVIFFLEYAASRAYESFAIANVADPLLLQTYSYFEPPHVDDFTVCPARPHSAWH